MNFYRVRLAAPLSVVLALALALSPSLSWYAYADDPFQGQETENERPEERGAAGSGDEPREVAEEPENDCEAGEGAAEGEAAPPSLPEVPSGAGPGSGGSAGPGLDGAPEDAYSSGGRDFESSVFQSLDDIVSILGEIADYYRSGTVGVSPLANIDSVYDQLVSFRSEIGSMLGSGLGHSSASNRYNWQIGPVSFNTGKGNLAWIVALIAFKLDAVYGNTSAIQSNTTSINSNVKLLTSIPSTLVNLYSLSKSQWGYGYGGTVVIESNSPAFWLKGAYSALYANNAAGNSVSVAGYLSAMSPYMVMIDQKLRPVSSIAGYLVANNASGNPVSVAGYLSAMSPYMVTIQKALDQANSYTVADSSLLSKGLDDLRKALYANNHAGNSVSVAGYLSTMSPYLFTIDQKLGLLAQIRSDLEANNSSGTLLSVAQYLSTMSPLLGSIDKYLSNLDRYSVSTSALLSKGFADLLQKLDGLTVEADVSIELSGLESRLDAIKNLLVAAGLIENGKDLLDVIFGDLSGIGQAAATGAIQSAMESAFPFCIPALVKQLFGLLAYEGSAPVWEFDICGNPLVCDFSDFQLVADCTSWLSRLGLVLALLVNTRKFVFAVNGGGAS